MASTHLSQPAAIPGPVSADPIWPLALWLPVLTGGAILSLSIGAPEFYRSAVEGELGALETLQVVVMAFAFLLSIRLAAAAFRSGSTGLRVWSSGLLLGCLYVLGEEVSWGQHYLGWATDGWFAANNDQGETNLHNTSSWLDQKPRLILFAGALLGGLVHPLLKAWRGRGLVDRPWWLFPTMVCMPPALLSVLAQLPETARDLGLVDGGSFYRESEVQEFYFYVFIMIYLLSLLRRFKQRHAT